MQSAAVHGYTTAFTVSAVLLAGAAVVAGVLVRASRHQVGTDAGFDAGTHGETEGESDAAPLEVLAHRESVRVEESVA